MKQKLITSTLAAYIAVDLTGWYETIPEQLICCIGLGLAVAAVWTWIEERRLHHDKNGTAEVGKRSVEKRYRLRTRGTGS
ncbi:hypothetical protein MCG98_18710 [Ruminococcus sp. OA3]|uniref:hypothetical protein n=1 Tax=Ruminococcus sp. OA3 TaxID=2914164 RepID=UPI001F05D7C2|nr:hypothetical protein [Ruminococcus sp. OA3]MCH1984577.1 hypothetical protein [Ruminococcus sp. OA3]MCH1984590.1 hypothetical protein [Ruminococcus sp. OA3]